MKVTAKELIEGFKKTDNEFVAMVDFMADLSNRISALEASKAPRNASKKK